ncbi:MAG TPA: hypothetical protein VLK58_28625 [Conexibacter sp.]|nr:hypothetical protein [Conexibacter sp.]
MLTALTLLVAIAVVATGAVTLSVDLGGETELPVSRSPETAFGMELVDRVAVLSRERTARDRIIPELMMTGLTELRPAASLRVFPPSGADSAVDDAVKMWLVPKGEDRLVLVTWAKGAAKATVVADVDRAELLRGRAVADIANYVLGLVPDGVERVTVTTRDGRETVLPVDGNVFAAPIEDGPHTGLAWEGMTRP